MDDLQYGTRDKRGNWAPNKHATVAPIWSFPPRLREVMGWLPGYFLPYNAIFALTAVLIWVFVVPEAAVLQTLAWGWILKLLLVNAAMILVWYGAWEVHFYVRRAQGTRFKYNGKFPSEHPSDVFWFKSQNVDNFLRTFLFGIPIWTAWEVLTLWAWANTWGTWFSFADHPVYLIAFALLVPVLHEFHFYLIHRLIHTPFLYRHVHSVHHNSINPSPWSSLSMHPVEHLLYFATAAYHLILPSHPLLAIYQLHFAGVGAFVGHIGFDRIEVGKDKSVESHAYIHYLHHKYFEVNYGDGLIPIDKWAGTFHDGSKDADEAMKQRFRAKKARIAATRNVST